MTWQTFYAAVYLGTDWSMSVQEAHIFVGKVERLEREQEKVYQQWSNIVDRARALDDTQEALRLYGIADRLWDKVLDLDEELLELDRETRSRNLLSRYRSILKSDSETAPYARLMVP